LSRTGKRLETSQHGLDSWSVSFTQSYSLLDTIAVGVRQAGTMIRTHNFCKCASVSKRSQIYHICFTRVRCTVVHRKGLVTTRDSIRTFSLSTSRYRYPERINLYRHSGHSKRMNYQAISIPFACLHFQTKVFWHAEFRLEQSDKFSKGHVVTHLHLKIPLWIAPAV
jgi:hypothetical protein